jgi:hypothetical protein
MSHVSLKRQVGRITQRLAHEADLATRRYEAAARAEAAGNNPRVWTDKLRFDMQRLRAALAHARQLLDAMEHL